MKFEDFFCGLFRLLLFSTASMVNTRSLSIKFLSCTILNSQIFNVSQTSVKSIVDCARLYLESESSKVMGVQRPNDGVVWCGLATEIPTLSSCSAQDSDVRVYHSTKRVPVCPVTCQAHLDLNKITYCIHKTTDRTMNYAEAVAYCEQYGGNVAQAETLDDLDILGNVQKTDDCSWLDGNDYQVQGVYRWERGDLVSSDLWHDGEPNYAHERCLVVIKRWYHYVFKLEDRGCSTLCYPLCPIDCLDL